MENRICMVVSIFFLSIYFVYELLTYISCISIVFLSLLSTIHESAPSSGIHPSSRSPVFNLSSEASPKYSIMSYRNCPRCPPFTCPSSIQALVTTSLVLMSCFTESSVLLSGSNTPSHQQRLQSLSSDFDNASEIKKLRATQKISSNIFGEYLFLPFVLSDQNQPYLQNTFKNLLHIHGHFCHRRSATLPMKIRCAVCFQWRLRRYPGAFFALSGIPDFFPLPVCRPRA